MIGISSISIRNAGIILLIALPIWVVPAQQSFDLQAYQNFLSANATLSSGELLALHPAGAFVSQIGVDPDSALYFDSINTRYTLTAGELGLLRKNGFVVSERLKRSSFGGAFLEIFKNDLPVFVSTDAILHAVHMSYDAILKDVENYYMIPGLRRLLADLQGAVPGIIARYDSIQGMNKSLDDIDLYFALARKLIGDSSVCYRTGNDTTAAHLLALIAAQQPYSYPLFSTEKRMLDFSQFKTRGHYTESQQLKCYFQSMIWLGRTELQLLGAKNTLDSLPPEDIKRQAIDAFLVLEAVEAAGDPALFDSLDYVIRFFVGESDNITLQNLRFLKNEIHLQVADELLDDSTLAVLKSTLREKSYAIQKINSQILITDPMNPAQLEPPAVFLLFGQRFVIDSYVTGNVVYDKIIYQNQKVFRKLPSSLDVLFALGNDASAQLLGEELDEYHYGPNLAALRYLVDSYDSTFWQSTLYNGWLNSIRSLNPPPARTELPAFMQTAAWWQEKLNTQLSSWAQLRHDNLLYVKQSYTGGVICSYPHSLVEPIPAFFRSMRRFAESGIDKFTNFQFSEAWMGTRINSYFSYVKNCMDTLGSISEKQLMNVQLSIEETDFLKKMMYTVTMCGPGYDGWYPRLYYHSMTDCDTADIVVADVHTAPTDEWGNMIGNVMHAGTGPLNLCVLLCDVSPQGMTAFIGPVMSYYEHVTVNFNRLTDEEWKTMYAIAPSFRPSWVNLYLADTSGGELPRGPALLTGAGGPVVHLPLPSTLQLYQNYPNPFNPVTLIGFKIPSSREVDLAIYELTGRRVRQLVKESLPAGNYMVRWDGRSDAGHVCSSGVYFYRLEAGGMTQTKQMTLMK